MLKKLIVGIVGFAAAAYYAVARYIRHRTNRLIRRCALAALAGLLIAWLLRKKK